MNGARTQVIPGLTPARIIPGTHIRLVASYPNDVGYFTHRECGNYAVYILRRRQGDIIKTRDLLTGDCIEMSEVDADRILQNESDAIEARRQLAA